MSALREPSADYIALDALCDVRELHLGISVGDRVFTSRGDGYHELDFLEVKAKRGSGGVSAIVASDKIVNGDIDRSASRLLAHLS